MEKMYSKFNRLKYFLLFVSQAMSSCFTSKEFIEIKSFIEIIDVFENIGKETLLVLDIDNTLISQKDLIWQKRFAEAFNKEKELRDLQSRVTEFNFSSFLKNSKRFLIEAEIINILNRLIKKYVKHRNFSVIGLTTCRVGPCGHIGSMSYWRVEDLLKLNLKFSDFWEEDPYEVFTNLKSTEGRYPIFYKGILFSNKIEKGPVLDSFLNKYDFKKIIFIDDLEENLESVKKYMTKRETVSCDCYLYTGADYLEGELNINNVKVQLTYLIKEDKWIPDTEIESVLLEIS